MKTFNDLKPGDKLYCLDLKERVLEISEVSTISFKSETYEFILKPIIGEWNYMWLTSAEILLSTLIYGHDFFTVDESIAV